MSPMNSYPITCKQSLSPKTAPALSLVIGISVSFSLSNVNCDFGFKLVFYLPRFLKRILASHSSCSCLFFVFLTSAFPCLMIMIGLEGSWGRSSSSEEEDSNSRSVEFIWLLYFLCMMRVLFFSRYLDDYLERDLQKFENWDALFVRALKSAGFESAMLLDWIDPSPSRSLFFWFCSICFKKSACCSFFLEAS